MKTKILLLLAMFTLTLAANQNPFILTHDGLIDQRAQDKIFQIGSETKSKLNVNLYVSIEENNGINMDKPIEERRKLMKLYEQRLLKDVKRPYVLLSMVIDQKYANILMSDDLKSIVDRDDVLDGYVIPLLASKDKNSLFAKTSAAALNGFAQIADSIAQSKNIKLESSIGSEGKTASTVWRVFMYTLVAAGILLYAIIVLREKNSKTENKMKETRDKYIYIKFLIIFCISLFMIIWTIVQTSKAGVGLDDDNAFLSTYQDVDANFNKIVMQNHSFEKKYNIKFTFNDQDIIGLTYDDVFLAQRVVQERKIRKDMVKIGQNNFTVLVQNKNGDLINEKKVEMLVTKSVTHDHDVKLSFNNEDTKTFEIDSIGYWNITGTVEVNGEKGFFYIKTNAKR